MKTDIEIAQDCKMLPIGDIASKFGIDSEFLEFYGKYKAKLSPELFESLKTAPDGKLILVTAINPTPAGEGKTTTTIGLAQALNLIGRKTIACLREPSLGPCMGQKGGATGGGYAQIVPMDDINLHFTGDLHAMTCANNLLAALIDNHIHQGNALRINPAKITWKRALDMNDRSLRQIVVSLGGPQNGIPREDSFQITVASEIMAIVCLAENLDDLKERLGAILIGHSYDNKPVYAKDLEATGAMTALLKNAFLPNIVQTLEHTPVLVHGGPFANIAHGCNSVTATRLALKLGDYIITEAGFGADLGAQKFFDIKCRKTGLKPDAAVLVATVRALKYNGGAKSLAAENTDALQTGFANLQKHISNLQSYKIPVLVALNVFPTDTDSEIDLVARLCKDEGADFAKSYVWEKGGEGGRELAESLLEVLEKPSDFTLLYPDNISLPEKIEIIAKKIYGADGVNITRGAAAKLKQAADLGLAHLPVCIAKTQYSLSDDQTLLGRPQGFVITIKDISISRGAGFIVALAGDIMTMPGLPKRPAAAGIDIIEGNITGLF